MITQEDVAKLAHVSCMTVSRVINGSDNVSKKTRQRVLKAIEDLNYHPNYLAKSLAVGSSSMIAYIVPDISDPYFGVVAKEIESYALKNGFFNVFFSAYNNSLLEDIIQLIIERKFDGVIIHDLDPTLQMIDQLTKNNISCVLVDNEKKFDSHASTIDLRHYDASYHIASILLQQGYDTIACVHGPLNRLKINNPKISRRQQQRRIWIERTKGFSDAMKEHNVTPLMIEVPDDHENSGFQNGKEVAVELLNLTSKNTSIAVYCEEDTVAMGLATFMLENGINIPDQVAVFGNDGLDITTLLFPKISTVIHPRKTIGKLASETIIDMINNHAPISHIMIELDNYFCGETTKQF